MIRTENAVLGARVVGWMMDGWRDRLTSAARTDKSRKEKKGVEEECGLSLLQPNHTEKLSTFGEINVTSRRDNVT